jgi:triacylglycerol esterase/lipase EstA (alpha/beta hydrolase family)
MWRTVVLVLVGGALVVPTSALALTYLAAARTRRRRAATCPFDGDDPLPRPAVLAGFVREMAAVVAAMITGLFPGDGRMASWQPGDPLPVLLVHGWGSRPSVFRTLRRRLLRDGWTAVVAARTPAFLADPDAAACRVGIAIDALRTATGAPHVDVVAHGLGGLVARAAVRDRGRGTAVRRLVTVATPHQGTTAGSWLALDPLIRATRPDAAWLAGLADADPVPALVDVVALYSLDDPFLEPPDLAYYPQAFNVVIRGAAHLALLGAAPVYELLREHLEPVRVPA